MNSTFIIGILSVLVLPQINDEAAVKPSDYTPCGLNSFFLVCQFFDIPIEWEKAKELLGPPSKEGQHSFDQLAQSGKSVGLFPIGLKTGISNIGQLPMPAIAHIRDLRQQDAPSHLVVILGIEDNKIWMLDPPGPAYSVPMSQFESIWTGNVLVFTRTEEESQKLLMRGWSNTLAWYALRGALLTGILALGGIVWRYRRALLTNRYLGIGTMCILLFSAIYIFYKNDPSPHCEVTTSSIDLGEVTPGNLKAYVEIKNSGKTTLFIKPIKSSCTCAKPIAPDSIEPGQSSRIEIELSISRNGPERVILIIQSNDPTGDKTVTINWHGQHPPTLHPVNVVSPFAPCDTPFKKTLTILYPSGDMSLRPVVERVETVSPYISIREGENRPFVQGLEGRIFGEQDLYLEITPSAPGAAVETECRLTIRLGKESYKLGFLVSVRFLGGKLTPDNFGLVFASPRTHDLIGQERWLRVATEEYSGNIEITDLPAWLKCDQEPSGKGYRLLKFTVLGTPEAHFVSHRIQLGIHGSTDKKIPVRIHLLTAP